MCSPEAPAVWRIFWADVVRTVMVCVGADDAIVVLATESVPETELESDEQPAPNASAQTASSGTMRRFRIGVMGTFEESCMETKVTLVKC